MIGGLGVPELVIILGIAVFVFGAAKIPEIAKSIGKAIVEFRKTGHEITHGYESHAENTEKKVEDKGS